MPPLTPSPNTVQLRFVGNYGTTTWQNGFYLQYSGTPPSESTLNSLAAQCATHWATTLGLLSVAAVTVVETHCTDLSSDTAATGIDTLARNGTHTGTTPLPANISGCLTWRVSQRWRGGHPRTYLPGMDISETLDHRLWNPTFQQLCATQAGNFRTALNGMTVGGNSWTMIALRRQGHLPDGTPIKYDPPRQLPIISVLMDSRIDTQRRRVGPDVAA